MFKIAVTAVALVLLVPQVTLAEWVPVATGSDNTASVDDSSVVRKGNMAFFWARTNYGTPTVKGVVEARSRMSINCSNGLQQTYTILGYNDQGIRVMEGSANGSKPEKTVPGTVGAAVAEFVCQ